MPTIPYTAPRRTAALFAVVTDQLPDAATLGDPPEGVSTTVWSRDESPFDPTKIRWYNRWEEEWSRPDRYHVLVCLDALATAQPGASQWGRAFAKRVAADCGGALIDWSTRELVFAPRRPERAVFHLGDQWLGIEFDSYEERHEGINLDEPGPCGANRVRTHGLPRFGLPDVVVDGIDCELVRVAQNVANLVAQQLLLGHWDGSWGQSGRRRLPDRLRVSDSAFTEFWRGTTSVEGFEVRLAGRGGLILVLDPAGGDVNRLLASLDPTLRVIMGEPPIDFDDYPTLAGPASGAQTLSAPRRRALGARRS